MAILNLVSNPQLATLLAAGCVKAMGFIITDLNLSGPQLYQRCRYSWLVNLARANNANYIFAIQNDTITEVYQVTNGFKKVSSSKRSEFDAVGANNSIRNMFIGTKLTFKKGSRNPIKYFY